jgi:hypothetical protein
MDPTLLLLAGVVVVDQFAAVNRHPGEAVGRQRGAVILRLAEVAARLRR